MWVIWDQYGTFIPVWFYVYIHSEGMLRMTTMVQKLTHLEIVDCVTFPELRCCLTKTVWWLTSMNKLHLWIKFLSTVDIIVSLYQFRFSIYLSMYPHRWLSLSVVCRYVCWCHIWMARRWIQQTRSWLSCELPPVSDPVLPIRNIANMCQQTYFFLGGGCSSYEINNSLKCVVMITFW